MVTSGGTSVRKKIHVSCIWGTANVPDHIKGSEDIHLYGFGRRLLTSETAAQQMSARIG